jgi:hypothetical protein
MARQARERESGDWLRNIAIGVVTAFLIDGFLQQAKGPQVKRQAGKIIPSVVPAGLPAFPGTGWVVYDPLKPAVVDRAKQLLFSLWRTGEGATMTEQTEGEWVTYQAQVHVEQGKRKHGVGAWRLKAGAQGALG